MAACCIAIREYWMIYRGTGRESWEEDREEKGWIGKIKREEREGKVLLMEKAREETGEMSKGTGRNRNETWESWEGGMNGKDGMGNWEGMKRQRKEKWDKGGRDRGRRNGKDGMGNWEGIKWQRMRKWEKGGKMEKSREEIREKGIGGSWEGNREKRPEKGLGMFGSEGRDKKNRKWEDVTEVWEKTKED
jgi:hypothetical protein